MANSKYLSVILVSTLTFAISWSAIASERKIIVSSFVDVQIGGDLGQYEQTMSKSRNQTRKMYMDEIIDAALKLSDGKFNPASMLGPLQKIQDIADGKRDMNKEIDSMGISLSVGQFFKSEIENLYLVNGLTRLERKIEFANMFPVVNGHVVYDSKVRFDHFISMQVAHVGNGNFRISATLGTLGEGGDERTFEGNGLLQSALAEVAEQVFRSVMKQQRPAMVNPNATLTWIPGPAGLSSFDAKEAHAYCLGQDARLPMAEELILAHHLTDYRVGGIQRFQVGENYFVGNKMRQAGVPIVVIMQNDGKNGKAIVQAVAGHIGKIWCVKGSLNQRNEIIQKIYSIRRQLDPKGMDIRFGIQNVPSGYLSAIKAVESLLIGINAAGAELGETLKQADLVGSDQALAELSKVGFTLTIPKVILDTMN
ncbi:MAG: hypothetical protein WA160_04425 [Pseudobdellovibrio sp.]